MGTLVQFLPVPVVVSVFRPLLVTVEFSSSDVGGIVCVLIMLRQYSTWSLLWDNCMRINRTWLLYIRIFNSFSADWVTDFSCSFMPVFCNPSWFVFNVLDSDWTHLAVLGSQCLVDTKVLILYTQSFDFTFEALTF